MAGVLATLLPPPHPHPLCLQACCRPAYALLTQCAVFSGACVPACVCVCVHDRGLDVVGQVVAVFKRLCLRAGW